MENNYLGIDVIQFKNECYVSESDLNDFNVRLIDVFNMFPRVATSLDAQTLDNEWQMYISNKNSLPEDQRNYKIWMCFGSE